MLPCLPPGDLPHLGIYSFPAWKIPWTEEPGGLEFMGSQRVKHGWSNLVWMKNKVNVYLPHVCLHVGIFIYVFILFVVFCFLKSSLLYISIYIHINRYKIYGVCSVTSVVSYSLWPSGLQPVRLLCPWDSLGKNTGVGCHAFLQGIFETQGLNSGLLHLIHWRQILYPWSHQGIRPPQIYKNLYIFLKLKK